MAENFIFTMQDLRKVRGGKDILKGIYLSFFPGAKIGVIGPNGAGKSTLLRIMAGQDSEFFGTARPDPSIRVGFLPQEPQLEPSLDVKGNVELGVKPLRDVLDRFNEVSNQLRGPDGNDYIVYHAWDVKMTARRMFIDRLVWTNDGPRCERRF